MVLKERPRDFLLLREGGPSANVRVPRISARVLCSLSPAEPPRCVSAGFSPIDAKGASQKYGRGRAHVHTAYTTFPQVPKLATKAHSSPQLHAFVQEKSTAPSPPAPTPQKTREIFVVRSVEKPPSCKIYFLRRIFLLLTYGIRCVQFLDSCSLDKFFFYFLSSRSNS